MTSSLLLVCLLVLTPLAIVRPIAGAKDKEPDPTAAPAGTYRRPLGNDPATLDPARISDIYSLSVTHQIFDGLVRFDHTLTISPALAQFWRSSRDGLTWTFTLRKGVKFHHGREVTSDDVVYSLTRILDPKTKSGAADLFTSIKGAQDFIRGRARTVAGLSAPDRYTVQVVLNEALTPFVSVLAVGHAKIVPRDLVEQQGDSFGANPVGTGPFKFVRWEPGKEIVLAANTDSFDGPPRLARLVYRIFPGEAIGQICQEFEQGNLEESSVPPMCRNKINDPRYQYLRRPTFSVRFYGLNTRLKPLTDVRVRQAIAHALDRESMIQDIFVGQHQLARGILPAGMPGYNPQLKALEYKPARSRALLKEAGFPDGRGLPTLEIWSAARSEHIEKELLGVKRQLAAVGIPAEVQYETNWPAFSQRLTEGRFSLFVYAWHADVPDPDNFLYKLFHSHSLRNLTRYSNPVVDDLLFEARRERDAVRRIEIYRRAEQIIVDEVPVVPVWHYTYERLFQSYVRNVEVNGLGDAYLPLRKLWLELPAPMMRWGRGITLEIRSLQTKFLIGSLLVLVLIMTGFIAVVERRQRSATVDEVQRRGEVLARSLATTSTGALLLYNFTALEQNVDQVAGEADVVYAIILDGDGTVVAHSRRPELVGSVLEGTVHDNAARSSNLLVQESAQRKTGEPLYDIAMPVYVEGQKWGVARIGLSRRRMEAQIRRTRWELAALSLVTLVIGGLGAAFVARRIAFPVRQLAAGAEAIARGELDQQIAPAGRDEIGQLALTFNHMAEQLRHHQTEIDATQAELRHRFEQLAELKNYTDSILGSVSSGIITLDLDGRVATMNPAAEMLTGLFAPDVKGRYCQEVFAHSPELSERLIDTLEQQSGIAYMSLTLHRPNGRTLPIEMSTAPLRGREGKDLGVVGVFRDVTVVRDLEEQLRRSDRLAALGTLAAGLAHEIKNPLTSLRTFTRFMPRKFDDLRFRERFERVVPHELERINAIVEQLLELARPARLVFQAVRLPELLDRTLDLYAHQIESKNIDVHREYARDCPPIQADPEYLYQGFLNLVANALEAMSPGGRLIVRAGWNHGVGASRPARSTGASREIKVEIEDTGKGISSSEADKIFNPFFTTKAAGTGLGLALTHKIVEDHAGSITFRSIPGTGTTFRVTLPVALPSHDSAETHDA